MAHSWKSASFAFQVVFYFNANVFSTAHQPTWTHFIIQSFFYVASVYLLPSQPLHPPTYSSHVPQPPLLSAAMFPCLPLGKEMRRGTDANILDPSLLPDSSPRDRNKDGVRKRGGRAGRKRWWGTGVRQNTDLHKTYIWLVHNEKTGKSGCRYVKAEFIIMQKAFSGKIEQQREHKPLNTALFLAFTLHPSFFSWCGCLIIQPAVLFQQFWGVIPFLCLVPSLCLAHLIVLCVCLCVTCLCFFSAIPMLKTDRVWGRKNCNELEKRCIKIYLMSQLLQSWQPTHAQ